MIYVLKNCLYHLVFSHVYYKLSGLKQHDRIILQFWRSEI